MIFVEHIEANSVTAGSCSDITELRGSDEWPLTSFNKDGGREGSGASHGGSCSPITPWSQREACFNVCKDFWVDLLLSHWGSRAVGSIPGSATCPWASPPEPQMCPAALRGVLVSFSGGPGEPGEPGEECERWKRRKNSVIHENMCYCTDTSSSSPRLLLLFIYIYIYI